MGTPAHVPYGGGVKVGTVTGVHPRKSGVVWVRYPNNPKLYEVERHLIFGTAQAAEAHLQKVCKGKTPTTNPPPPPTKPANPPTNPQENHQPNPITPTNPPNPPRETPATPALWDPETRSQKVYHGKNGRNGQAHEPQRLKGMSYVFLCLCREGSFLENLFKFCWFKF